MSRFLFTASIVIALAFAAIPSSAQTQTGPFLAANINQQAVWGRFDSPAIGRSLGHSFFFYNTTPAAKIWHTDGTAQGTFRIADGVDRSFPLQWIRTVEDNVFYYAAMGERSLWRTDGTTPGTRRISSIQAFFGGDRCGDRLCFSGGGNLLRATDGASEEILLSTEPAVTQSTFPDSFVSVGDHAFFVGLNNGTGPCVYLGSYAHCGEIWKSDGTTAGTRMVVDLMPGPFPSAPLNLTPFGSKLAFAAFSPHDQSLEAKYVFVSDGTAEGTELLSKELRVHPVYGVGLIPGARYLYIGMDDGRLMQTDGTPGFIRNFNEVVGLPPLTFFTAIVDLEDAQLYVTVDANHAHELAVYRSGGVLSLHKDRTIQPVADLPGAGTIYVAGDATRARAALWKTDGRTVERITSLPGDTTAAIGAGRAGKNGYFSIYNGSYWEMWQTDATAAGTRRLGQVFNGDGSSFPKNLQRVGENVFFFAVEDNSRGFYVFETGSGAYRRLLTCDYCEQPFRNDGDRIYLFAPDGLWTSDGTASGTGLVKNLLGATRVVRSAFAEVSGGTIYVADFGSQVALFSRTGATHTRIATLQGTSYYDVQQFGNRALIAATGDREGLIITDGTAEGTKNLAPGLAMASHIKVTGARAWFASDGALWSTDGTAEGTRMVPGSPPASSHIAFLATRGESVIVSAASDGAIYVGTADGVQRIASGAETVVVADGVVYLLQKPDSSKLTLLAWNGEAGEARKLRSIDVGMGGTLLSDGRHALVAYQKPDLSYFVLNVRTGAETPIEMNLYSPLDFRHMAMARGRLYFPAWQTKNGEELWVLPIDHALPVSLPEFSVEHLSTGVVNGRRAVTFRITMRGSRAGVVPIRFTTISGSAREGRDFEKAEGVAHFGHTDVAYTIVVPVTAEGSGTFSLFIRGDSDVEITRATSTVSLGPARTSRHRAVGK